MGAAFWVKRYLLAAVPLFAILAVIEYLKGSATAVDYLSAAVWAAVAAAIFVGAAYRRYKKAMDCPMCDDITQPRKKN
ncbi:hypothetical protein ACHMW6_15995 [Pseudoduganella sp. UC29_106]|uniref:hypothetical protein n=1 Tax=Pseudoduganella sp. UC29_106 TaxID=3374553 RepID=UPI003756A637